VLTPKRLFILLYYELNLTSGSGGGSGGGGGCSSSCCLADPLCVSDPTYVSEKLMEQNPKFFLKKTKQTNKQTNNVRMDFLFF